MKRHPIGFEFVDQVPASREERRLYISINYRTAIHNCFCGCGEKVVTPIRPTGWRLTYDGDTVSLHPSIGNWSFKCRSHYVIRNNVAIPAGPMSEDEIDAGRLSDRETRDRYFRTKREPARASAESVQKRRKLVDWLVGRK